MVTILNHQKQSLLLVLLMFNRLLRGYIDESSLAADFASNKCSALASLCPAFV